MVWYGMVWYGMVSCTIHIFERITATATDGIVPYVYTVSYLIVSS